MDDFGSSLTGQPAVEPADAKNRWDSWLDRPGNRTAMLQMGINLMQPVGVGQSAFGQLGQAIGAGGEAVGREEAADLKEQMATAKLADADNRLAVAQQNANANTSRAASAATRAAQPKGVGLTEAFRARAAREDAKAFERQLDKDAAAIEKRANDPVGGIMNKDDPVIQQYKGKTREEIRDALRATRPKPKYGAVPSNDPAEEDDDGEDDGTPAATAVPKTGAPAGFQQYSDGNYYKPDPANPGKVLRWRP